MILPEPERTARLRSVWVDYQAAERQAFDAYRGTCQSLLMVRDDTLAQIRAIDRANFDQALAEYQTKVSAVIDALDSGGEAIAAEAKAAIQAIWAAYMTTRAQSVAWLHDGEAKIDGQYRADLAAAVELYQSELTTARQGWQSVISNPVLPAIEAVTNGHG